MKTTYWSNHIWYKTALSESYLFVLHTTCRIYVLYLRELNQVRDMAFYENTIQLSVIQKSNPNFGPLNVRLCNLCTLLLDALLVLSSFMQKRPCSLIWEILLKYYLCAERSLPRKRPSLSWRSSVNLRMMMVSCPSSPSSRGCALLRSKKPTCSLARKNKDNSTFRTSLDFVEFWQLKIREKQKPSTHHRGSFMKPKLLLWNNFNF